MGNNNRSTPEVEAKRAAFETAYKAAISGEKLDQGAINKVYDQTLKKAYSQQGKSEKDAGAGQSTEFDIVNTSKKLAKSYTNSTRAKALRAEKEYEAYTVSDEHQKELAQANKTALEESMRRIFSTPGVSASDALIGVGQEVPVDSKERERKAMVE